ncbi:MAG: histidine phosphatase family protein, partial [Gammaproteobacteria bacterium]|nr:histidine phosphatase family protein [Gammaproteobacteria bacterium]
LQEVDIPDWQGLKHSEIQDKSPTLLQAFHESPGKFEIYSDGELRRPLFDLYQRVCGFMGERISRSKSRILVVSHLGTSQALINVALGLTESNHHCIQQSQCAVSRLEFRATGNAELTRLNDTGHLGQPLPKIKSQKNGVRVIFLGFADRANLQGLDFSILNAEEDSVWIENGLDAEGLALPLKPAVFSIGIDGLDKSLAERIKQLRMHGNHVSTLLIATRSASLTKIAESLFGIPQALMASVHNSTEFSMVVHDSTEQARPIVQLLNNSIAGFLKQ